MDLIKIIGYKIKVIIAMISAGIWIYFRTPDCYVLIKRKSLFSVLFVMIWTYLVCYEPLCLPLGLLVMIIYMASLKKCKKCKNKKCQCKY